MRQRREVKMLCSNLVGLQGNILLYPKGLSEFLFTVGFELHFNEIEAVRKGLEDLGMYEEVVGSVRESEKLALAGNFDEAAMIILEMNRKLSKLSGAEDDLRRIYTAANDPDTRA